MIFALYGFRERRTSHMEIVLAVRAMISESRTVLVTCVASVEGFVIWWGIKQGQRMVLVRLVIGLTRKVET